MGGGWIGERTSLESPQEAVAIIKARATGGLDQGREQAVLREINWILVVFGSDV